MLGLNTLDSDGMELRTMRNFIAVPIIVLGVSITVIAALLDYIGGLVMGLGCIVAGDSPNDKFWLKRTHQEDRHFNS
jgi:ABC-type amino acid transport system permease subunit